MKLFDFIKVLFGSEVSWNKLNPYDKSKNVFMVNRFMSIKWPIQANLFNQLGTNPVGTIDSWRLITSKFNRVPGFIYTKVRSTKKKEKIWKPNSKLAEAYMSINEIGEREFNEALKYDSLQVKKAIDILEKQLGNDFN